MADNTNTVANSLPEKTLERLQHELALSRGAIDQLPENRMARALLKLEIESRPEERMRHERGALLSDDGEISSGGASRALAQADAMRKASRAIQRKVAGVPIGISTAPPAHDTRLSGLDTSATGWVGLGPGNIGGRTRAIVIHPTDSNRIFATGVGGGVWRSVDGGASWVPLNDWMANLAVCSLVMDPTDPNTLYAGTGEGFGNVDAIRGDGVFRTTDGGNTWTPLAATAGNPDFHSVNSLAISDTGQVLLAGTNAGVIRSTNAGNTWTNTALTAPISNLAFDPSNSNRAIAGGRTGRAYFSTDGGGTWAEAARPTAPTSRIQVCYAAADANIVYASVNAQPSELWRSTDGGRTYASRLAVLAGGSAADFLGGQGWYDNALWAGDPTDADLVIAGGVDLYRSTDGGNTLRPISTWWSEQSAHADHHAIVADPGYDGTVNRRVYIGNDGGVQRTDDATTVGNNASEPYTNGWAHLNNGYGVTQFYYGAGHIGTSMIMGGAQDNGTLRYTPAGGANGWVEVWGGDGGAMASDPADSQTWYGEYVYMEIFRITNGGIPSQFPDGYITGRFWQPGVGWQWKPAPFSVPEVQNGQAQFIAPFVIDPNEPERILGGAMSLWRTDDARTANTNMDGPAWTAVKAPIGNSPWTHSITAIAVADGDSDTVLVGHANGNVYRATDATAASPQWMQIDTNGIGAHRQCLALCIDPDDHDLAYAGFGGFQADNLWRTANGGQTWTDISGTLPDAPIRAITVHPQRSGWIYVATQVGLFASEDGGATWSATNEGPANVACHDLFWLGCKLICVTHGRGMFEIDLPIANAFAFPELAFTGTEDYSVGGNDFTRYRLEVSNRGVYPNSLFRPSPDLPPCGANANSSRTWVDIFNGDNDQRLYGFCALGSADALGGLWFALPRGNAPPGSVYVVLRDRRCPSTYNSAPVQLTTPVSPSIRNPVPGSTFTGDNVTFEWSAEGAIVSQWWLYVGSTSGASDIYNSGSLGTSLVETVTGLPKDGSMVFARLWFRVGGVWQHLDAQYTAVKALAPEIVSPPDGSVLGDQNVTFEWAHNGTAVAQWWLYVGTRVGGYDIYDSGSLGTRLHETVSGLPADGSAVHVRLWYRTGGAWKYLDASYTALSTRDSGIT